MRIRMCSNIINYVGHIHIENLETWWNLEYWAMRRRISVEKYTKNFENYMRK